MMEPLYFKILVDSIINMDRLSSKGAYAGTAPGLLCH